MGEENGNGTSKVRFVIDIDLRTSEIALEAPKNFTLALGMLEMAKLALYEKRDKGTESQITKAIVMPSFMRSN